jgi:23S rRNA (cytidine1920-2'-O)/16S rRNA (cytidine1409-2'-O)-methyltransferase
MFDDDDDVDSDAADGGDEDAPAAASHSRGFVPAFDLVVADLSFISQTLVLPAVVPLLKAGGTLLTLVKPQFELQPGQVGKGGIVKDASMYLLVEQRLRDACADLGLTVTAWFDSSIAGGDGNREFFICAHKPGETAISE